MTPKSGTTTTLYGGAEHRRITIVDLKAAKAAGEKWAALTSYEQMTAEIFDAAGIPVLLVGDSAGNNFLGEENTIAVTVDELIPLTRAVVRASKRALVVADLPFGSYESSPEQALQTSTRFFKEAGAFAIVLELVPAELAARITAALSIPTIGIGAGVDCDAQILVWTDLVGLTAKPPKLAKAYRNLRQEISGAAQEFASDVRGGTFPGPENTFN